MRMNNRNKQEFWYSLYGTTVENVDEYGNYLGTYVTYGNPVKATGNISAAKGEVDARQFGDEIDYSRTIMVEDRDTPIDEYTVLWIDKTPELNADGSLKLDNRGNMVTPWNYTVRSVARGLPAFGNAVIAVRQVTVS